MINCFLRNQNLTNLHGLCNQEQNMQTEGLLQQQPPIYQAEVITTLMEEVSNCFHNFITTI